MLNSLLNLIRRAYDLWDRVNKAETRLDRMQDELEQLQEMAQRLIFEQQRERENHVHEREKLKLQLENALLKFERRLPPERPTKGK